MFRKILLPTDGSRHALEAARVAGELSVRHAAAVFPIVAVEYDFLAGEDVPPEVAAAIRSRIDARAAAALAATAEAVQRAGGSVAPGRVLEGPSAEVILREAGEGLYDLIVMGSRGVSEERGHLRLLGSVTERVLHATPCPVLVLRAAPRS
jgi:nucleotide-binding universal stress UspA family protein